jgi:hypothetical protein
LIDPFNIGSFPFSPYAVRGEGYASAAELIIRILHRHMEVSRHFYYGSFIYSVSILIFLFAALVLRAEPHF